MAASHLLPSLDLPGANWADRHSLISRKAELSAFDATRLAFAGKPPRWISSLMSLRNFLNGLIGLKAAVASVDQDRVGAFPIVSQSERKVVLGFDDWHLDFRIVVETLRMGDGTRVYVSTLVNRKNWFGRAYILLVTPFHILIVRRLLARLQ